MSQSLHCGCASITIDIDEFVIYDNDFYYIFASELSAWFMFQFPYMKNFIIYYNYDYDYDNIMIMIMFMIILFVSFGSELFAWLCFNYHR